MLFVILLWLWLPTLLVCSRCRGFLCVIVARDGLFQIGDKAMERVVDLLEERHAAAAALVRG